MDAPSRNRYIDTLCILVANEPRSYREAFAIALRGLRPHAEITVVEPDDLDSATLCLQPHLILCSRLTEVVQTRPISWALLYPGGESHCVTSVAGKQRREPDLQLDDLLAVLDETQLLVRSA